jgi:hypothetical protein
MYLNTAGVVLNMAGTYKTTLKKIWTFFDALSICFCFGLHFFTNQVANKATSH